MSASLVARILGERRRLTEYACAREISPKAHKAVVYNREMLGNIAKILGKSDSKRHPLTCTPERAFEWIDDRLGYTHDNLVGLLPCPRREILEAQLGLYQDIFDALELLIEGHTTTHDLHQFNDSPRRK